MSNYPNSRSNDRLNKRELGELLRIIADALTRGKDIQKADLQGFFRRLDFYGTSLDRFSVETNDELFHYMNYLRQFRTNEQLREFLQVVYGKRIPSRLSKENLQYLGLGIMLSSNVSLQTAKETWENRKDSIQKDIYNLNRNELINLLSDKYLFPDGYSIVAYAKRFHIRLPKIKDKNKLINILLEKLYDRPLSSKEIGRWGLSNQGNK